MNYWCKNNVTFTGEENAVHDVTDYFKNIEQGKSDIDLNWRSPFVENVLCNELSIKYNSRWLPNNQALYQLADRFHVGFVNQYHELNKGIVGEAVYLDGRYSDMRLDGNDLEKLNYDAGKRIFVFKRTEEEELPALLQLLETKKEITKSIAAQTFRGNYF